MKALRTMLAVASLLFLAAGYFASQVAFAKNTAPNFAATIDSPVIRGVSAVILISALVLAFIKEGDPETK